MPGEARDPERRRRGRGARRAARLHGPHRPSAHPGAPGAGLRGRERGRRGAHPRPRDAHGGGGRSRVPRRGIARAVAYSGRGDRGRAGAHRPRSPPRPRRARAAGVRAARPQPRAHGARGRRTHGDLPLLRTALHPGSRRPAPPCDARRPRQPPAAQSHGVIGAHRGRPDRRTGGRAGTPPAPAHDLECAHPLRQAHHRQCDRARAGRGHRRDAEARLRGGACDPRHLRHLPHQQQLAAGMGRDHARRAQGLRRRQPGGVVFALLHDRGEHARQATPGPWPWSPRRP